MTGSAASSDSSSWMAWGSKGGADRGHKTSREAKARVEASSKSQHVCKTLSKELSDADFGVLGLCPG